MKIVELLNRVFLQWLYFRIVLAWNVEDQRYDGWGIISPVKPLSGWRDQPLGAFGKDPVIYWLW